MTTLQPGQCPLHAHCVWPLLSPLGLPCGASPEPSNLWGPTIGTHFERLYVLSALQDNRRRIPSSAQDVHWPTERLSGLTRPSGAQRGLINGRSVSWPSQKPSAEDCNTVMKAWHYAPPLPETPSSETVPSSRPLSTAAMGSVRLEDASARVLYT